MKIAQLLYSGLGGHGSVAFSLLAADKKREWQPQLGFLGIEPLSPAYADACKRQGIPFEYFAAKSGKPWKTWPSIARWLDACRPDAIVLHSVSALLPSIWQAHRLGVPLVVVEHQANALKRRSEWVYSGLAMMLADRVVVLTPDYQLELKNQLRILYRPDKVQVIPNGIDSTRFIPKKHSVVTGAVVRLGMASRFTAIKRHDVLVEMLATLRSTAPEIDWQLSLAGGGETWEGIRQMAQALGVEAFINLPGQLDEPELIKWYQSLDIYLHASEGETLSTSLLQAMATALPIVASDVPGITNLLKNDGGQLGLLVEGNTAEAFATGIASLHFNRTLQVQLASTARAYVVRSYNHQTMFKSYNNLIQGARN